MAINRTVGVSVEPNHREMLGLLDRCGPRLYGLLVRLTLRREAAEELLQELFVKLEGAKGFWQAADRESYAFRTAIHLALDWRRRAKRERVARTVPRPENQEMPALVRLIQDEQVQEVFARLENLTELEREAVVLRYIEQLEYAEVGKRMGKTGHQARGLCHRAIRALQEILGVRRGAEVCDD